MREVDEIIKLINSPEAIAATQSYDEQSREFEQFLSDMKINVEKKKILISREDVVPETVFLNG